MAWADKDKQAALEAIDKIVADTGLSVRKAIAEVSRMSGMSASTLTKWYYPGPGALCNTENENEKEVSVRLKNVEVKTVFSPLVAHIGRPKIFETPEDLKNACVEYFQWAEANPLMEYKILKGEVVAIPKLRAWTLSGLRLFLGISENTWTNYRNKPEFMRVSQAAESLIYEQKFTGAAADLLNANIISRDLGLMDRQQISTQDEIKGLSKEQLIDKIKQLSKISEEGTEQEDTDDKGKIFQIN